MTLHHPHGTPAPRSLYRRVLRAWQNHGLIGVLMRTVRVLSFPWLVFADYMRHTTLARIVRVRREEGWGSVLERGLRKFRLPDVLVYAVWRLFHERAPAQNISDFGAGHVLITRPGYNLARDARAWFARALERNPNLRIAYGDHDHVRMGIRIQPWFKPDFDPVLWQGLDYLGGAMLVAKDLAREDLWTGIGRMNFAPGEVVHIPRVLTHLRAKSSVRPRSQIAQSLTERPRVSVLVPTRDRPDFLAACLNGLNRCTDYPDLEIILIDHETKDPTALDLIRDAESRGAKVLRVEGAFNFSAFNNMAARQATGKFLLLLNNDISMADPGWLNAMVRHAQVADVGVVGARLLYPDGTLQHGGVNLGVSGVAVHAQTGLGRSEDGYMFLAHLTRQVSAVTAACLLTPRDLYLELGGLDEVELKVAYNDVDYCLKASRAGYRIIYAADAILTHHESVSRGSDETGENRSRILREVATMKRRWRHEIDRDPYYHPALTAWGPGYGLAFPPRFDPDRDSV